MRKFFELLRVNILLALMQLNLTRRIKGKSSGSSSTYMLFGVAALMMLYMGWISNNIYSTIGEMGFGWLLIAFGLILVSIFTLVSGLYSANPVLFEGRDLDQLFSYPISPFQILFSKVFALVAENWIVGTFLFFPALVVYAINVKPDILFYLFAVVGFLCTPFLPVCIFVLLAYLLNALTRGIRAKATINTIVTFGLIVGAAIGIKQLVSGIKTADINFSALLTDFKKYYPPLGYLTSGIVNKNAIDWLIGILWNVIPFVVLCVVLSFGYRALLSNTKKISKSRNKKLSFGVNSGFSTLLRKELLRYFSSVMYVINSSIGMVLMTLFAVMSGTGGKQIQNLEKLFPSDMHVLFVLLIFAFTLVLTNTTAPSISLEGKNLWIIKSWPVDEGQILLAKLCVHLIITIPILAVNCIIIGFTMQLGIANCLIVFLLCAMFSVSSGFIGLIFNLFYQRLDFYSDTQVVKNSASVLLNYLTMALITGVFAGIYYLYHDNLSLNLFLIIVGVSLFIIMVCSGNFVFTKGKNLFKNISG